MRTSALVVAGLLAVGALSTGFGRPVHHAASSLRAQVPASVPRPPAALVTATSVEPPRRLSIPTIGVDVALGTLGLHRDRTVQVPTDPETAGWYRFGPAPGQVGSAVILGHVDSDAGPAVFYRLAGLRVGDRIRVQSFSGEQLSFRVTRVAAYRNADFPAKAVYGDHGFRGLNLITCGDGFSQTTGYLGNVVVFTRLISPT